MTIAAQAALVVGLFIVATGFVYLHARSAPWRRGARVLRWLAFALTLGIAITLSVHSLSEPGGDLSALVALSAVPLFIALLPLISDVAQRAVGTVTTVAAVVMLSWGLILGLGDGFYYVYPALVLGAAAVASIRPRHTALRGNEDHLQRR